MATVWHPQPLSVTPRIDTLFRFLIDETKSDEDILKLNDKIRQAVYNEIREMLGQPRQHGRLNMSEQLPLHPAIDRDLLQIYRMYVRERNGEGFNQCVLDACVAVIRFMERNSMKYWVSEYPPDLGDGPALAAAELLYKQLERMGHVTRRR